MAGELQTLYAAQPYTVLSRVGYPFMYLGCSTRLT